MQPKSQPNRRRPGNRSTLPIYLAIALLLGLLGAAYLVFGPAQARVEQPVALAPSSTATLQRAVSQALTPSTAPGTAQETTQGAANLDTSGSLAEGAATPTEALLTATLTPAPVVTQDPVATVTPPTSPDTQTRYFADTGHTVTGTFLNYYNTTPHAIDLLGLPLTEAFSQTYPDGTVYYVQYFERSRLEYHPELPLGGQVQLGLVGTAMLNGRTFDTVTPTANTATHVYFPQTGHTLSNGFLNYWKANGGLPVFGYPLSEEIGEDGIAVQYFERARFEYYAGLEGTPYAVQISPAGYYALKTTGLNILMGTLVRANPPHVAEGHTAVLQVGISAGVTVTAQYEGNTLLFKSDPAKGMAWALIGAQPFHDLGNHPITINFENGDGGKRTITRTLETVSYPFPSESLQFDPETAKLLDPAITQKEAAMLAQIFAGRTAEQGWTGFFRMPLDGPIRMTSAFATRRCYNCPDGSTPTTYHGGMDMAANVGTPVHAPAAGTIVFAGQLSDRGNAIIIDHGMGVFSLLAHNSKLIAAVGQHVEQGEVISLSGNTGLSNGPHLHWEVHVSGPGVEPREWVKRLIPQD